MIEILKSGEEIDTTKIKGDGFDFIGLCWNAGVTNTKLTMVEYLTMGIGSSINIIMENFITNKVVNYFI